METSKGSGTWLKPLASFRPKSDRNFKQCKANVGCSNDPCKNVRYQIFVVIILCVLSKYFAFVFGGQSRTQSSLIVLANTKRNSGMLKIQWLLRKNMKLSKKRKKSVLSEINECLLHNSPFYSKFFTNYNIRAIILKITQ